MSTTFDVFVSYNSRDGEIVRYAAEELRKRGLKVWFDEWELQPGSDWLEALSNAIEVTPTAVIFVGAAGLGPWGSRESKAILSESVDRGLKVIPALLPGGPPRPPLLLRGSSLVDLRSGVTTQGLDLLEWGISGKKPPMGQGGPRPDESWLEPATGVRFLWVPGGRFLMGSEDDENSQPVHGVVVSPFWLGETAITNRQYDIFRKAKGNPKLLVRRKKRFSSPSQPVVTVSWNMAMEFCFWCSEVTGLNVNLPSEAQWEFAAKGTTGKKYAWGNERPDKTRGCFGQRQSDGKPAKVGTFPEGRGPFGHHDLAGNTWEFCLDVFDRHEYARRAHGKVIDPVVESESVVEKNNRVIRGGCWSSRAGLLRSSCRTWASASELYPGVGFRVAIIPD